MGRGVGGKRGGVGGRDWLYSETFSSNIFPYKSGTTRSYTFLRVVKHVK